VCHAVGVCETTDQLSSIHGFITFLTRIDAVVLVKWNQIHSVVGRTVENMISTSHSLLQRLRGGTETQSWNRFVRLYTPVIYKWVRRKGISASDSHDLVQDVFRSLIRTLPKFEHETAGSFGNWLRKITTNKCRDYFRRKAFRRTTSLPDVEVSSADNVDAFAQHEYQRSLAKQALQMMQQEFEYTTWKAAWEHIVSGRSAKDIANELGISTNAVYVSKSRVLRRLRAELDGFWE